MNIEERLERLESFIGNIDQIRLYANSLQEVIDKYLAPLYIELGSGHTMLINDYLGDLENIPHNVIFKIKTSHDLDMGEEDQAIIRFQRGTKFKEYTLRKMVSGSLVPLESSNYTAGEVYDVYINSQNVAIITANDTGVRALSELASLSVSLNSRIDALTNTVNTNNTTLNNKINTNANTAKTYTDTKTAANKTLIDELEAFLSGITKDGNNYTFRGNIVAAYIETPSLRTTRTVNMSGTSGFVLPSGTTIADPSANLGLANRQWVNSRISTEVSNYFTSHHYASTEEASAVSSRLANGSFYYKLSR